MHGALGTIHVLKALANILQANPTSPRRAVEQNGSGFLRWLVFDEDSEVIPSALCLDKNESALWTSCNTVSNRVLHQWLKDEPRNEGLRKIRVEIPMHGETIAEAHGFDRKIFLGDS